MRCCRQPLDERQHGRGEMIVAVARHHVARATHINVIRMRDELEKLLGVRRLHELGGCAAHEQRWNPDPARGLDQGGFERLPVGFGGARTFEEARIPMPAPAPVGSIRTTVAWL